MDVPDPKEALHSYLREARAAVLWKLSDLSEYDVRRPLTPHGTNLLGLVKHLSGCEIGYFGYVFDRPCPDPPVWLSSDQRDIDMWAQPNESRWSVTDLYRRACAQSDRTIDDLSLDSVGRIPSWPPERRNVTLQQVLAHMIAETSRHAGHADIVRELVDGTSGRTPDDPVDEPDPAYWPEFRARVDRAARSAANHRP